MMVVMSSNEGSNEGSNDGSNEGLVVLGINLVIIENTQRLD